jgi:hypothetical protein
MATNFQYPERDKAERDFEINYLASHYGLPKKAARAV